MKNVVSEFSLYYIYVLNNIHVYFSYLLVHLNLISVNQGFVNLAES